MKVLACSQHTKRRKGLFSDSGETLTVADGSQALLHSLMSGYLLSSCVPN